MKTEIARKAKATPYDTVDYLKSDEQCAAYLQAVLEEGDPSLLAAALGDVMRARVSNVSELARRVEMSRFGLYKALSTEGNPSFATVAKVAREMGLNVVFEPAARLDRARGEVKQVTKQAEYSKHILKPVKEPHVVIDRGAVATAKGAVSRGLASSYASSRSANRKGQVSAAKSGGKRKK